MRRGQGEREGGKRGGGKGRTGKKNIKRGDAELGGEDEIRGGGGVIGGRGG